jgi:glutathione synthase/RimK-type ligase-like ATP-grasp enzyme
MKLYAYNNGSASAKSLAKDLGIKRLKREGRPINVDVLLNWGCSSRNILREINYKGVLNIPGAVSTAANKLQAFKALSGHTPIPDWTEERVEASKWLAEGVKAVCRTVLNGHSGEGVVIAQKEEELVDAPLYVKYIPKKEEYRLHVFRDKVFFTQRKARKVDVPDDKVNWQIRNHGNGFIYANANVEPTPEMEEAAIIAVKTLGLDFGAVDLIYNQKANKYYVLEVNCAPGLSGTTLAKYVDVFKEFV